MEALKKLNRKDCNKYVVDTMGESVHFILNLETQSDIKRFIKYRQYGVQVVRTPPYMAEYAPIEFGWSAMKRAQHDFITHTDDGKVIRTKLLEWMNAYPAEKCKKYMDHCKGVEEASHDINHTIKDSFIYKYKHMYFRKGLRKVHLPSSHLSPQKRSSPPPMISSTRTTSSQLRTWRNCYICLTTRKKNIANFCDF